MKKLYSFAIKVKQMLKSKPITRTLKAFSVIDALKRARQAGLLIGATKIHVGRKM